MSNSKDFFYTVEFYSYASFEQMKMKPTDEKNTVRMFCQNDDGSEEGVKEVIFSLPTSAVYNDEHAQFSVSKEEAALIVDILKRHFNL